MKTKPNSRSIALITLFWSILQLTGLFRPGLLDDVDSVYLEIAREMLHRHDYVTPTIDGIRFFDKPPLMYWLAAASMRLFGEHDWAGRVPLALAVLALLLAVYFLGLRLYAAVSPKQNPDRGALLSALALATALGPYLYTRFYIPDILIALWMTLSVHLFLAALDRVQTAPSSLLYPVLFAITLALNLLTKGLIGLVFPIAFVLLYLALTRQLRALPKLHPTASLVTFAAIALPWHILAAVRNPAIATPSGLGLPPRAGWAWFYLYNEHFARFLGKRIPHDYGQTPVWLFWLYAALWIFPWVTFLPPAIAQVFRDLGHRFPVTIRNREAALTVTLWSLIVLVFFTLSSRQEYYSLPALPALALMVGGFLARTDHSLLQVPQDPHAEGEGTVGTLPAQALAAHRWFLLPLSVLVATVCLFYTVSAPHQPATADLFTVLNSNPANYNLSLGHLFDLTGPAMGFFRLPLALTAAGMLILGPASYALRRRARTYAANLTLAAGMTLVLLAAHEGLVRFNPILGSKPLADAILAAQAHNPRQNDLILLDGELTSGSTLLFYTHQPVHLVEGRVNGPWFGSFWPDAPPIFETDASLDRLWASPQRLFLLTYNPAARTADLSRFGAVHMLATQGGKTILCNR